MKRLAMVVLLYSPAILLGMALTLIRPFTILNFVGFLLGLFCLRAFYKVYHGASIWSTKTWVVVFAELILFVNIFIMAPGHKDIFKKSQEGATRKNMLEFRGFLAKATQDPKGSRYQPPKFLLRLPRTGHQETYAVRISSWTDVADTGQWLIVHNEDSRSQDILVVDCIHTDSHGKPWSSY